MDIALKYADYAIRSRFEDLPSDVVDCAKKLILDTLGVVIAGSSAKGIETFVALVREWGGKPESSILLWGGRAPTPYAVACTASMARANDFDAVHEKGIVHIAAPIVPGCLAVAERAGGVSGKEFITAVVSGIEVMARLGLSIDTSFIKTGFQTTNHIGSFGNAIAAGRLLGLNREQMVHALGIAYGQIAGTIQATVEGTVMVRLQQGFAAQIGVLSAIMAQRGIDGPQEVFQGKFGYFPVFHQNRYNPSLADRDLGGHFEIKNVSIKYYPCCFLSHFAISAMLQLAREERIDHREVEAIRVGVNQGAYNVVCDPIEAKRNPSSAPEALFSLPYTVACALLRGHVLLEDFKTEAIRDREVLALAQKVTAVVDPQIEREFGRVIGPAVVEVALKGGRKVSRRVDFVKGHPDHPMSMDDCEEKFRSCLPSSAKPLPEKNVSAIIRAVRELETLEDVSRITDEMK